MGGPWRRFWRGQVSMWSRCRRRCPRMLEKGQRTNTKNDHTDALLIARIGARDHDLPAPRPDGEIEDLRCLVYYRRELVETRNRHVNRLHADLEQLHCGYHHNIPTRLTTPTALTKASYLLRGDRNTRAGVAKRRNPSHP